MSQQWDWEVRPRRSRRRAVIVAIVLVVAFGAAAVGLRAGDTGVSFRWADQVAVAGVGVVGALAALMLTRPRVRVGSAGVAVRNVLGEKVFAWKDIRGVSFPDRKSWARLELRGDEYVPLMAIRANDRDYAATSMERFREFGAHYSRLVDQSDS